MERENQNRLPDKRPGAAVTTQKPRQSHAQPAPDPAIGLADLIHEIRNPLNGMDTTLQLMGRHLSKVRAYEDPVMVSYVQSLRKEIQRIHSMLLDIQTLWRADLQFGPIEISILVGDILKTDPFSNGECGIHVERDVSKDLPPVRADDKLLKRALSNLIKNAVEAMPEGGTLTFRAYAQKSAVVLEIGDTGVGIPHNAKIFEAFATSKPGGMGLGLNIVQRIVSALGGEVAYSSQAGKGTTFRLTLPQWKKDAGGGGSPRKKPEGQ